MAQVKVDFDVIEALSKLARERYGMGGAVQHGASTLPAELFDRFPKLGACEIHLATEFQNMIFDHPAFPAELKRAIYERLRTMAADERKAERHRRAVLLQDAQEGASACSSASCGACRRRCARAIGQSLEDKFRFLLQKLQVPGTRGGGGEVRAVRAGLVPGAGRRRRRRRGHEDVTGPGGLGDRTCRTAPLPLSQFILQQERQHPEASGRVHRAC